MRGSAECPARRLSYAGPRVRRSRAEGPSRALIASRGHARPAHRPATKTPGKELENPKSSTANLMRLAAGALRQGEPMKKRTAQDEPEQQTGVPAPSSTTTWTKTSSAATRQSPVHPAGRAAPHGGSRPRVLDTRGVTVTAAYRKLSAPAPSWIRWPKSETRETNPRCRRRPRCYSGLLTTNRSRRPNQRSPCHLFWWRRYPCHRRP